MAIFCLICGKVKCSQCGAQIKVDELRGQQPELVDECQQCLMEATLKTIAVAKTANDLFKKEVR